VPEVQFLAGPLIALLGAALTAAHSVPPPSSTTPDPAARLTDFRAIEFRRYIIHADQRERFATYFESYFPEAFQQIGAIAAGAFFERKNPTGFTWIRGFHTIEDRAIANAAFYYGSVWKEHRKTLNDLITDSDNVMLLRPLSPERGVTILQAVDPVTETDGAHGVVVAQIFAVKSDNVDAFVKEAEPTFARYRATGAREAGVLVTLDAANNFPQLPVRTDGPFLVWLGILRDDQMLDRDFMPIAEGDTRALLATGFLRGTPELVILDPTRRSRMRWLP
jgi:hypothetical protein